MNETIVVRVMHSDSAARRAYEAAVQAFQCEFPTFKVVSQIIDEPEFKEKFIGWLTCDVPDVASWFCGRNMLNLAASGHFEELTEVLDASGREKLKSFENLTSIDGKFYFLPTSYYSWSLLYRKDLFLRAGRLDCPINWNDLLNIGEKLRCFGISPLAIGLSEPWVAAALFEIINLRLNGLEFHQQLVSGTVGLNHFQVKNSFDHLKMLHRAGFFIDNAAHLNPMQTLDTFFQGQTAMYFGPTFAMAYCPQNLNEQIASTIFPVIDPRVPNAEIVPTDGYLIPALAKNKVGAKAFIKFFARPEIQREYNRIFSQFSPYDFPLGTCINQQNMNQLSSFFDRDASTHHVTEIFSYLTNIFTKSH